MRLLCCALLASALAMPVAARVYQGQEAAALRCANTMALTAVALDSVGRLGEDEKNVLLGITVLILERHVGGTWSQKKEAMSIVRDRRALHETLEDFERFAAQCIQQFPIN